MDPDNSRDVANIENELPIPVSDEHLNLPVQECDSGFSQSNTEQDELPEENVFIGSERELLQGDHETFRASKDQTSEKEEDPKTEVCTASPIPAKLHSSVNPFNWNQNFISQPNLNWLQISTKWRKKYEKLVINEELITVGSLIYVNADDFLIAKGPDGTKTYLGLKNDGSEVLIKKTPKSNQVLKREEEFIRHPDLDDPSILRYVDSAEDENFWYLALQLYEHTLEEYVRIYIVGSSENSSEKQRSLVLDILMGLRVLHYCNPPVLHGDINEQNILIDVKHRAKLSDFSKSCQLTSNQEQQNRLGSDIQMAGKQVYYLLSGGHHLPGNSLDPVQDVVAMDLIAGMINEDPQKRLTIKECLEHSFFWMLPRREEYLRRVGNKEEVKLYKKPDADLISSLEKYDKKGYFKQWKTKLQLSEGVKPEILKPYTENAFGLLRYYRNQCEHPAESNVNLMKIFPDLFGHVYKFAESQGWNSEPPLKDVFLFAMEGTGYVMQEKSQEERVTSSLLES